MKAYIAIIFISLLIGCTPQESEESVEKGGMKCGAGKCGASMVDGSVLLVKKKMNILNQLEKEDSRRECVLNAISTKILYDCVRDEKSKRLSLKLVKEKMETEKGVMKCAVGKCGGM